MSFVAVFLPFLLITFVRGQQLPGPCSQDQGKIEFCHQDGKLVIHSPKHVERIVIARLNDSTISDIRRIDPREFDQRRLKAVADFQNKSTCSITSDRVDLSRVTNVNDLRLVDYSWYAVCFVFRANSSDRRLSEHLRNISLARWAMSDRLVNITNRADEGCSRCAVINPSGNYKLITEGWNSKSPRLAASEDAPFESMLVSGRINDERESRRVFQFEREMRPGDLIRIQVTVPTEFGRHSLAADVIPKAKNGNELTIDGVQLILYDYLGVAKTDGLAPLPGCTHYCCTHTCRR